MKKEVVQQDIQNLNDFSAMYFSSPVIWEERRLDSIADLLDLYTKKQKNGSEFRTMLDFSNWLTCKVKANHTFGLLFPSKEMLILSFVVEQGFCMKSNWSRDQKTGKLQGSWVNKIDNIK
jgi:hypothetical protein